MPDRCRPGHTILFRRRHVLGGSPTARRKSFDKWAWSAMPQASAIWLSGSCVVSIKRCARSTLRRVIFQKKNNLFGKYLG